MLRVDGAQHHLADFLAVSHINVPGKATYWEPRPTHFPWITAGQKPVLAGRDETLSGLVSTDFNPRQSVFLPLEACSQVDGHQFLAGNCFE